MPGRQHREAQVGYQEPHKRCRDVFSLIFCICAAPVFQGGVKLKAEQAQKGSILLFRWCFSVQWKVGDHQSLCAALFWKKLGCWHGFWWISGSSRTLSGVQTAFLSQKSLGEKQVPSHQLGHLWLGYSTC